MTALQAGQSGPPAPSAHPERRPRLVTPVPDEIVEACSLASLQIGGTTISRLGITSAIRGEGRTTVAIAMALVQQQDYDRRALLLELDLEHPSIARRLGLRMQPGLAELVRGDASAGEVTQLWSERVAVVTAGGPVVRGDRVLTRLLSTELLTDISQGFDLVVADLPPILGSTVGRLPLSAFEPLLLVVRAGITPVARVREAVAGMPSQPAVILNGA